MTESKTLYRYIGGAEGGGRRGDHGSPYPTRANVFHNQDM